jgi:hypothetical protein
VAWRCKRAEPGRFVKGLCRAGHLRFCGGNDGFVNVGADHSPIAPYPRSGVFPSYVMTAFAAVYASNRATRIGGVRPGCNGCTLFVTVTVPSVLEKDMTAPDGLPCIAAVVHESIVKFARLGVIPLLSVNVGSHVTATVNGEPSVQRLIVTSDTTPHRGAAASQFKRCEAHPQSWNRIWVTRPLLLFGSRSTPLRQLVPK